MQCNRHSFEDRETVIEKVWDDILEEQSLQSWNVVGSDGKALRRSRRKREENRKSYKNAKKVWIKGVTTSNNATAKNIKTTTTTKNKYSTILTNKNIKNKNKKLNRINTKEQKSQEELEHVAKVSSPMLLDLNKAITRAQESSKKRSTCCLTESRDPKHKNKAEVTGKDAEVAVNSDGSDAESDSSVASMKSKKSYVSMARSRSRNNEKADMFNKQHEDKIEAECRITLQLQLQQNVIQNSNIRQSKRLSGAQNNFFEFDNKNMSTK
jgi:hypothetical protein